MLCPLFCFTTIYHFPFLLLPYDLHPTSAQLLNLCEFYRVQLKIRHIPKSFPE